MDAEAMQRLQARGMQKDMIMRPITLLLMLIAQPVVWHNLTADAATLHRDRDGLDCNGAGSGFLVQADGLKDRSGRMVVELYPANQADFLKGQGALQRERKIFRRVEAPVPARGAARLCIPVPKPRAYALVFIHDRDGNDKFNIWQDGIGLPVRA